jgi:hypothetical protein
VTGGKFREKKTDTYDLRSSSTNPHLHFVYEVLDRLLFFPERNKTMSALTEATVIVEAGETSGTLI